FAKWNQCWPRARSSPSPRVAGRGSRAAPSRFKGTNTRLSVRLAVLPVADEILDHGRAGQRRGVAEIAVLVFRNLAQDPAHDLARARLRQAGRELNEIG